MANYLSYCVFILAVLIMSICVWFTVANSLATHTEELNNLEKKGELIFVHVLFRHGDRNPVFPAPGSTSVWPEGWGQLTSLGIQQEYSLGQWFRRRYNYFLSDEYHARDIYVQSSDVDRTLMSAQSLLAGLYPPHGKNNWNRNLLWRPIPVHTAPVTMDHLIAAEMPTCPSYENAKIGFAASDEITKLQKSMPPIYEYITLNLGTKISSLFKLLILRDTWMCESAHNYTLPQWVGKLYPNNDDVERAAITWFNILTGTKFLSKFRSGFLLKDILDRFTSKVQNSITPDRKLWMYSSHDTTVFSFLRSLDISDNQLVPYAGAIMLELRKHENEHYVQIFYKNSESNPEPIEIPRCGTACPLSKMYEIYDDIIPKNDFNTECLIPEVMV